MGFIRPWSYPYGGPSRSRAHCGPGHPWPFCPTLHPLLQVAPPVLCAWPLRARCCLDRRGSWGPLPAPFWTDLEGGVNSLSIIGGGGGGGGGGGCGGGTAITAAHLGRSWPSHVQICFNRISRLRHRRRGRCRGGGRCDGRFLVLVGETFPLLEVGFNATRTSYRCVEDVSRWVRTVICTVRRRVSTHVSAH